MGDKNTLCPRCGSELGVTTRNINPKPKGVMGFCIDDIVSVYTCICGYKASEFELSLDWAKKNWDKETENLLHQLAFVDLEGIDG